jgi:uncharacterized lipoprotein YajG
MKKIILVLAIISSLFAACNTSQSLTAIEPKSGTFDLPASGEFTIWQNTTHSSFTITLTNKNPKQSCEVYTVNKNGKQKWINPSLLANTTLTVNVPKDGHLFFKNFNSNNLVINYQVNQ